MITILDYGMGNIRSVEKAFEFLGSSVSIRTDLAQTSKLVLPGVGAFGAAMTRLEPLKKDIQAAAASGMPILGICLGQQLLFESSEEMGEFEGLGLLQGRVKYLPKLDGIKIPHVGWNEIKYVGSSESSADQVYFVHSLYTDCTDDSDIFARSTHGITFPAMVRHNNVWGCQFHPEKSGEVGLNILKNFIAC